MSGRAKLAEPSLLAYHAFFTPRHRKISRKDPARNASAFGGCGRGAKTQRFERLGQPLALQLATLVSAG
jgi:hypothetical protein